MFYLKFSKDYEQIFPFSERVYSFIKGYLPSNNSNILDIGCATGHYCGKFAADGYKITGIDLDPDMIRTAVDTYPAAKFAVLTLINIASLTTEFGMDFSGYKMGLYSPVG